MKNLIIFCSIISIQLSFSQTLYLTEYYESHEERLFKTVVVEFEELSQKQIKQKVEAWGQSKFVNYSKVLTSDSEEQLSFRFLLDYSYQAQLGVDMNDSYYIKFSYSN